MASGWYKEGLHGLMNKEIDLDTDTIKVRAVADEGYTFNATTHTTMSDVTAYVGSTDATLTTDITALAKGTLDASDLSPAFSSLAINASDDIDGLVVYHFVTNDAGSTPLVYIDLTTPITPNGGDINITWNASGVASL